MKNALISILFATLALYGCGDDESTMGTGGNGAMGGGTGGSGGGTGGSGGGTGGSGGGTGGSGGTAAAGGGGGTPGAVFEQSFETLDASSANALGDDGWVFFGNVFDSGGDFKFGFGPQPAPNATFDPANIFISAVVTGQGGPTQGDQQLSIFSDYNCCQPGEGHFGTDMVEVNVFQEINPIPAEFIGQTITFSFDAKAGDIGGDTTAAGYVQTLDPDDGFARTNLETVDTTNLPDTWGRLSVSLDLSDPLLEGQILQFGFQNTASDFDPSNVFYDNVLAELE